MDGTRAGIGGVFAPGAAAEARDHSPASKLLECVNGLGLGGTLVKRTLSRDKRDPETS